MCSLQGASYTVPHTMRPLQDALYKFARRKGRVPYSQQE